MSELYIRLGKALKLERQNKGLSLAQVADQLKSSESTLERVEEGDFSSFSSPVYFNLHAKSYAEALGIDYVRTLEAIRDDLGEAAPEPVANGTVSRPGAATIVKENIDIPGRRKHLWLYIVLPLIILGGIAAWILLSKDKPSVQNTPAQTPAVSSQQMPDPLSGMQPDTSVFTLSLEARGSSWVALMTDGDTALYRTFSAGETLEVSAVRQMILTVGTPSQVDLRLNGHPVKMADRSGRIANVVITPNNVRAFTGVIDSIPQMNSDSVGGAMTSGNVADSIQRATGGAGR